MLFFVHKDFRSVQSMFNDREDIRLLPKQQQIGVIPCLVSRIESG